MLRAVLLCLLVSMASCAGPVYAATYPSIQSYAGVAYPPSCGTYPCTVGPVSDVAGMIAATAAAVPGPYTWATCSVGSAVRVYASNANTCATYSYAFTLSPSCNGADVLSADGLTCTGAAPPSSLDYSLIGVDAATILLVYTWGMGVVLSMWAIGFAAGVAVKVINAL